MHPRNWLITSFLSQKMCSLCKPTFYISKRVQPLTCKQSIQHDTFPWRFYLAKRLFRFSYIYLFLSVIAFPWSEVTTPPGPSGNVALQKNKDPELDQRLDFTSTGDSTDEDVTIVPAVVVIAVLATPILLVLVALIVQRMHMRRKVQRAVKQRQLQPRPTNKGVCGWCCAPPRYYYDSNRDFDKLVRGSTDDSTDDEEEDLFSRKA